MARHTFPLDGEYVIKVKLLEINLGSIRGLEDEHQLEVTVDGERVLLAPVGGPEEYTESSLNATNVVNSLAERLQVRVKVKAGQRPVGAAFLQQDRGAGRQPPADLPAQHADRDRSPRRAARRERDDHGARSMPTGASDTPSRRRLFICTPDDPSRASGSASSKVEGRRRAEEAACAETDRVDAGAPRLSPAGDRRGRDAAS